MGWDEDLPEEMGTVSSVDELLMVAVAIAVASVVIVAFLIALYLWAMRRQRELDEGRESGSHLDGGDAPAREDRNDLP